MASPMNPTWWRCRRPIGDAHAAAHRGGHDDPAEPLPPHHRNDCPQGMKSPVRPASISCRQISSLTSSQRPGADDAGVRHHDVEAAQVVDRLLDGGADRRRIAYVQRQRQAMPAQLFDQFASPAGRPRCPGVGQVRHRVGGIGGLRCRVLRPLAPVRVRAPASSPAGDQGDPSIESAHKGRSYLQTKDETLAGLPCVMKSIVVGYISALAVAAAARAARTAATTLAATWSCFRWWSCRHCSRCR